MEAPRGVAPGLFREAGPLLERMLSGSAGAVILCDMREPDTPIVFVNETFEQISGYPAAEALGRNSRFLQGQGTDPDAVARMREAIARGDSLTLTVLNYRRDGTPFWNELRLVPLPGSGGSIDHYLGLAWDVSPRVRAETDLARAAALHTSVFTVMREGLLVIDTAGAVLDANPAALRIMAVSRADLDRPDWWEALQVRLPDGQALTVAASPGAAAVRERRTVRDARLLIRRGDGADRLVVLSYDPVPLPGSAAGGLVISFRDETDRRRTEEDLQQFAAIIQGSSNFVAIADLDERIRYINDAGRRLVGLGPDGDARSMRLGDLVPPERRSEFTAGELSATLSEGRWQGESYLRHLSTGAEIPVRVNSYLVRHPESGQPWVLATIRIDIGEQRRAIADVVAGRERYEAQFRSLPLPTYVWRRCGDDFCLVDWNAAAEVFTDGSVERLRGLEAREMFADDLEILLALERCSATHSPLTREMSYTLRSTGEAKDLIVTFAWVPPDLVLIHTLDITGRVQSERRLQRIVDEDDLTGLHNRRYLERRLGDLLGRRSLAVVIIDVDHFKFVNDSLGHATGDELLRELSTIMRLRLRLRDEDVLARFGGDEFVALLLDADERRAQAAAGHLLAAIRAGVRAVSVTASAGVAVFPLRTSAAVTASDAIVAADIALYEAKQKGRDRVATYSGQAGRSLTWLQQIRRAIADDRLVLHGQPVIELGGGLSPEPRYELLVRLIDEQGQLIPPDSFLPTAEQFGVIRDIDRWVVERGIEVAGAGNWVSINLSARSLADPELPDWVGERIAAAGVPAGRVTFEFTETAAVSSLEEARAQTEALTALGCQTALDDFGTGFGTFLLLKHLPVTALKIDREFVYQLSTSPADQRVVQQIIHIARQEGLFTVAEGVEDAGALALLREYGVDFAQGYHIAHPAPVPRPASAGA